MCRSWVFGLTLLPAHLQTCPIKKGHPNAQPRNDFSWLSQRTYFEGHSKILIFQDAPRFHKLIVRTLLRFYQPPSIIQKVSRSSQIILDLLRFTYVLRWSTIIQDLLRLPHPVFRLYLKRARLKTVLGPPKIIFNFGAPGLSNLFKHWPSGLFHWSQITKKTFHVLW